MASINEIRTEKSCGSDGSFSGPRGAETMMIRAVERRHRLLLLAVPLNFMVENKLGRKIFFSLPQIRDQLASGGNGPLVPNRIHISPRSLWAAWVESGM